MAGHRLGALEWGGGSPSPFPMRLWRYGLPQNPLLTPPDQSDHRRKKRNITIGNIRSPPPPLLNSVCPPKAPPTHPHQHPPPPQTKVTIVGNSEIYRENLVGHFLVHKPLGPSPCPPSKAAVVGMGGGGVIPLPEDNSRPKGLCLGEEAAAAPPPPLPQLARGGQDPTVSHKRMAPPLPGTHTGPAVSPARERHRGGLGAVLGLSSDRKVGCAAPRQVPQGRQQARATRRGLAPTQPLPRPPPGSSGWRPLRIPVRLSFGSFFSVKDRP